MSEFNAKITANVDTSKAEAQLNALTGKDRKVNIQTTVNGNGVDSLNNSIQQTQGSANKLSVSLKDMAAMRLKSDAISAIKSQAESAVKAVTDLNQAMTLVNMTMSNMTDASLNSLKQQSIDMAKELSTYTKTVTDAITIYANENESAASMLTKAQPTVLLSAASGMKASAAADAIQGIMNQFSLAKDQAMHVADVTEKLSSEINFSLGCKEYVIDCRYHRILGDGKFLNLYEVGWNISEFLNGDVPKNNGKYLYWLGLHSGSNRLCFKGHGTIELEYKLPLKVGGFIN